MPPARERVAATRVIRVADRDRVFGINSEQASISAFSTIRFSACRDQIREILVSIQAKNANAPTWCEGNEVVVCHWGAVNTIAIP